MISSGVFSRPAFRGGAGSVRAARRVGRRGEHRLAVAAEELDARAVDRQAGADRLHEHVAAAVLRLLDDEAEVGDEDQPRVFDAVAVAACRRLVLASSWSSVVLRRRGLAIGAEVQQEQAAACPGRCPARYWPTSMLS